MFCEGFARVTIIVAENIFKNSANNCSDTIVKKLFQGIA
jgi:hypothetical protein